MKDFARLVEESLAALARRNEENRAWGIDRAARWQLDLDRRQLLFTMPEGRRVSAEPQIVGSIDGRTGRWLWAWSNSSVDEPLAEHARRLRELGEREGIVALTQPSWPAEEQDGWNMTALALRLFDAAGAYRAPSGDLAVFMTFDNVKLLQD